MTRVLHSSACCFSGNGTGVLLASLYRTVIGGLVGENTLCGKLTMRANVMACELVRGTRLDHGGALYGYCTGLVAVERDKSTLDQKDFLLSVFSPLK